MKTNYLSLLLLSCFIIGCNNEDPPNINLEELWGPYTRDTRIVHLNGEEFLPHEEQVSLLFPADLNMPNNEDETMVLELFPIWPKPQTISPFDYLIHVEMQATATPTEVILKGNYSDSPYYTVDIEGKWTEEVLEVDLNYKSTDERLVGNTFIIRMNEDALDFSRLYPSSNMVEFDGLSIPIEDFVRDAMSPIFRALSQRLGHEIKLTMKEDGSMEISTKKEGSNNFINIPGKHRHWLHSDNHGYFDTDYEGATWLHEIIHENEYHISLSGIFDTATRNYTQNFAPILYYFDNGDLIYCNQNWGSWLFEKYLTLLLNSYRLSTTGTYGMTFEERKKISSLIDLIDNNIIRGDIFIKAEKQ